MKLKEFFELNLDNIPSLTIGAIDGQRWVCYYDGSSWIGNNREEYFDREVKELWFRPGRKIKMNSKGESILPLKPGIAIIITGNEHGEI